MTERSGAGGRRKTLTKGGPALLGFAKKQNATESHRMTSDTTSDVQTRSYTGHLENTYKLQPADSERFESYRVEQVMRDILETRLGELTYDRDTSNTLSKDLANEIHRKVKEFQWKRYKLVCHVTIGQSTRQGVHVVSRCVWDSKLDSYACVRYSNANLFAVAQCYGVYFE